MAATESPPPPAVAGRQWARYELLTGAPGRADDALERVVAPTVRDAVEGAGCERWLFTRTDDPRGDRLTLLFKSGAGWDGGDLDRLGMLLAERLEKLSAEPERRLGGLLAALGPDPEPKPAELLTREAAFEPGLAGEDERLAAAASRLAVEAIPELVSGHDRAAYALAAMRAPVEAAVAPAAREQFWGERDRRLSAGDPGTEAQLAGVSVTLEALAADLEGRVAALGQPGRLAAALEAFTEATHAVIREAASADSASLEALVGRHLRATNARLGVSIAEELLLTRVQATLERQKPKPPPAEEAPAVEVRGVAKRDEATPPVHGGTFAVRRGEIFGLLGPPEDGTTTLLEIAAGLRNPTEGNVRVWGADPAAEPAAAFDRVAVAQTELPTSERLTVRQSLTLLQPDERQSLTTLLDATELLDEAGTAVDELDPGRLRLLALARALVTGPHVIVIDEPTAGLDPEARETVWRVLRRQAEEGRSVLIATAAAQEALSLCDRVAAVEAGVVVAVDEPGQVIAASFSEQEVVFETAEEPARELLEQLPEARSFAVHEADERFVVSVTTLQPDQLLSVLSSDPAFPEITATHPTEREDR